MLIAVGKDAIDMSRRSTNRTSGCRARCIRSSWAGRFGDRPSLVTPPPAIRLALLGRTRPGDPDVLGQISSTQWQRAGATHFAGNYSGQTESFSAICIQTISLALAISKGSWKHPGHQGTRASRLGGGIAFDLFLDGFLDLEIKRIALAFFC